MSALQIARCFAAAQHYDQHAHVQQQVAKQLLTMMQQNLPYLAEARVLEIGCGSGLFSQLFIQHYHRFAALYLNDLYPQVQHNFAHDQRCIWKIGDIENLTLPDHLDLVVSCSALQWMTDLATLLQRLAQQLQPQGYLCFASYAEDNLKQIKQLTGQGLDYHSLEATVLLLKQAGFEVLLQQQTRLNLDFSHPHEILQHIKATGVQATAQGFRWSKASLQQFYQDYHQFQDPETQRYLLTYHPIYLIARKI